MTLQRLLKPK